MSKIKNRKRLRLSLLSWLIGFTLACIAVGYVSLEYQASVSEKAAIERLRDLGAAVDVGYWHEATFLDEHSARPFLIQDWLMNVFGEHSFARVYEISIFGEFESLDDLELEHFKHIFSLVVTCPKLENIEGLRDLRSLKWLWICAEDLGNFQPIGEAEIEDLDIRGNEGLRDTTFLKNMQSLDKLQLVDCVGISVLNLEGAVNLTTIYIQGCENLVSISGLPPSLINLSIDKCPKLKTVDDLDKLPKLDYLSVDDCPSFSGTVESLNLDASQFVYLNLGQGEIEAEKETEEDN